MDGPGNRPIPLIERMVSGVSNELDALRRTVRRMEKARTERDRLIVEARELGMTWRSIAEAAGLTELATRQAASRTNGGELPTPE